MTPHKNLPYEQPVGNEIKKCKMNMEEPTPPTGRPRRANVKRVCYNESSTPNIKPVNTPSIKARKKIASETCLY